LSRNPQAPDSSTPLPNTSLSRNSPGRVGTNICFIPFLLPFRMYPHQSSALSMFTTAGRSPIDSPAQAVSESAGHTIRCYLRLSRVRTSTPSVTYVLSVPASVVHVAENSPSGIHQHSIPGQTSSVIGEAGFDTFLAFCLQQSSLFAIFDTGWSTTSRHSPRVFEIGAFSGIPREGRTCQEYFHSLSFSC
jgi:hypothetical protein